MQKLPAVASLVVAAVLAMSCSNTDARLAPTGPTLVSSESAQSATLEMIAPTVHRTISFGGCPATSPFTAFLGVSVRAGDISIAVVEIGVRFVDTSGMQAPQITLPAPVPTTQFGTALIQARGTQTFPLTLGLGCGVGTRGTVTVIVITRDGRGRITTGTVSGMLR